jgi:hypothetical protein
MTKFYSSKEKHGLRYWEEEAEENIWGEAR